LDAYARGEVLRFVEDRAAGWGVREFRNLDLPREGPRPGHLDLGWAYLVRQVGTRQTGRVEHVTVFYHVGRRRRRFRGHLADRVLKVVQEHRPDAAPAATPDGGRRVSPGSLLRELKPSSGPGALGTPRSS